MNSAMQCDNDQLHTRRLAGVLWPPAFSAERRRHRRFPPYNQYWG
jgi:hypothetical protein